MKLRQWSWSCPGSHATSKHDDCVETMKSACDSHGVEDCVSLCVSYMNARRLEGWKAERLEDRKEFHLLRPLILRSEYQMTHTSLASLTIQILTLYADLTLIPKPYHSYCSCRQLNTLFGWSMLRTGNEESCHLLMSTDWMRSHLRPAKFEPMYIVRYM